MKLLISALFISGAAFAQPTYDSCLSAAMGYGDRHLPTDIPAGCFEVITNAASGQQKASSLDAKTSIIGHGAIIYIGTYEESGNGELVLVKNEPLAGAKSKISNLGKLLLNEEEKRFYTLNFSDTGEASILSFASDHGGNLAPLRKLVGEEIAQASSFAIDNGSQKIFAVSENQSWLRVFNLHADPDGRAPANAVGKLGEIRSPLNSPIDVAAAEGLVFVLQSDRVHVYASEGEDDRQPIQTLDGSAFAGAKSVRFDPIKNALVVVDQEGAEFVFRKNQDGLFALEN